MNADLRDTTPPGATSSEVQLRVGDAIVHADLVVPRDAHGVVLFAHGSGSSRFSRRNRAVARSLQDAGFATLLVDLLTAEEAREDEITGEFRFDIERLGTRLAAATAWLKADPRTSTLPIGLFGASTGAAAALVAAAGHPERVAAVVSRGGRPDLAGPRLGRVRAPTLLIVGGDDPVVLQLNQQARARLATTSALTVVPGAGPLFEEPGAMEAVMAAARNWFERYLVRESAPAGATGAQAG